MLPQKIFVATVDLPLKAMAVWAILVPDLEAAGTGLDKKALKQIVKERKAVVQPIKLARIVDGQAAISEGLAPGAYKVSWHMKTPDGHKTEGDFAFTVK